MTGVDGTAMSRGSSGRARWAARPASTASAKALECEHRARATRDPGVTRMYAELANQWRELADQIERNKR